MKNKTLAVWITLIGGCLGLHRLYLRGRWDARSALWCVPTLLGAYGVMRARTFGLDDHWSWVLIPLLGFVFAASALLAIVMGLSEPEKWNLRYNPGADREDRAGQTQWLTIGGVVLALMFGATALLASIAVGLQRYVEYQFDPSQAADAPSIKKSAD